MPTELYRLRPSAFYRPFDHRLQLAQRLVAGDLPAPARSWPDAVVERAAAVLRGDGPDAAIEAALRLRQDGPALDRGELDGRILAGHPSEDIATALNLPIDVVEVYGSLFFDVSRSVDHRWLAAGGAAVGFGVTEPEALIRWAGYQGFVGEVAQYFRQGLDKLAELTEGPDLAGEEVETMRSCRRWLEVMALSVEDPVRVLAHQCNIKLPPASPERTGRRTPALQVRDATRG